MVFYFTATGNSLYAAKQLDSQCISIAQAIHEKVNTFQAEKIGIVCPVYGHEVPLLVKEFLNEKTFDTPYFYMVLTYGNRHANAVKLAQEMLEQAGIQAAYINVLLMADNFLPAFDMEKQKAIDKKVDEHIRRIQVDIEHNKVYIAPVSKKDCQAHQEYLDRMSKLPKDMFAKLYRITEDCIGCEICTRVCPRKCFTMKEHKSVWNAKGCICCMACIHACPMMAIQMNIAEKNPKARYRNENISICEIVDANDQWKEDNDQEVKGSFDRQS